MWTLFLHRLLRRLIVDGRLAVAVGSGPETVFGQGSGPVVRVRLRDNATVRRLVTDPELAVGECYVEGALQVDGDDVQGLLALLCRNGAWLRRQSAPANVLARLRRLTRTRDQRNDRNGAAHNASHHYDIPPEVYALFLDEDLQYSCGYFPEGFHSLDEAQAAKKAHVMRKLLLRPGQRVLDLGCGWGGMALSLARDHGVQVLGITLSAEQVQVARARALRAGLSDQVRFECMDYRDLDDTFDRIVSVGMFEHVGVPNFDRYFATLADRLVPDGVALVHSIMRTAPPDATNPWIARHVFPGGSIPSLSEVTASLERTGWRIGDIECWRLHYARTLRHWFDRFSANIGQAERLGGVRFARMWRFYLAACEQTFRYTPQDVFQFQLCRQPDAVPLTRDYLYAATAPMASALAPPGPTLLPPGPSRPETAIH